MAPVYAELAQALPTEPVLNVDETGHRTNGAKRWLWGVVAATFVVYRIAASRGADVLQDLLGPSFAGVVGSDRLLSYLSYAVDRRQFCWAHVVRGLKSAQELATTRSGQRFCGEALALTRRLFRRWRRFRGDPAARGAPLSRAQLIRQAEPIAKALHALADQFVIAPIGTCGTSTHRSCSSERVVARATASIAGLGSRPATLPPEPTRSAASFAITAALTLSWLACMPSLQPRSC